MFSRLYSSYFFLHKLKFLKIILLFIIIHIIQIMNAGGIVYDFNDDVCIVVMIDRSL